MSTIEAETRTVVGVVALLVVVFFCIGALWGLDAERCAATRGGRTCVETNQGGESELIFYPDKVVRD